MLVCTKCGTENPLGRVFCGACGKKLETDGISSDDLAGSEAGNWFVENSKYFMVAAFVVVLILLGLALWPNKVTMGDAGSRVGGLRVERQISAIKRVRKGMTVGPFSFSEKDVNGFLESRKNKWKVDSASVNFDEGSFSMRVVKTLVTIPAGPVTVSPRITYEITCSAVGGSVGVRSAKVGHLSVGGPLKRIPLQKIYKMVSNESEWDDLAGIEEITINDGKISVVVKK